MKSQITLSDAETGFISRALDAYIDQNKETNPSFHVLREIFYSATTNGDAIRLVADHGRVENFKKARGEG